MGLPSDGAAARKRTSYRTMPSAVDCPPYPGRGFWVPRLAEQEPGEQGPGQAPAPCFNNAV